MMNSLYGKFGTSNYIRSRYPYYDEEVVKLANTYNLYKDKLKEIEKLKKEAEEIKNTMPEQIFN